MSLLLGTDMERLVQGRITGKVARVGGTVNQLINYGSPAITGVEDINLIDDFFGTVSLRDLKEFRQLSRGIRNRVRQEVLRVVKGHAIPLDRKTVVLDVHEACNDPEIQGRYDSIISSNLIEHSPNPILLLLNLHFMTRCNGYQFHAIPHYKYTYDCHRIPTPLDHLIEDFEKMTDISDTTHHDDYIQSAIEKHGWMREFHTRYPVGPPYIHFHVFDEENTRSLMELIFQDVVCDVLKNDTFSDNVVLFRNELNPLFVERFKPLMKCYSENFLGES